MYIKGIKNHIYTNLIIKWSVIIGDFLVLWLLLPFVIESVPHSEEWNEDKHLIFWMVCTLSMVVSEYWFSSVIHKRMVGVGQILKRSTLLVLTQTLLTYLALRAIHFTYRFGWQLFHMGLYMLVIIVLLRYIERWMLKRFRKLGYNTRKVTIVGADPSDFASLLSHPEDLHLGDEVYLCVARRERELIERTASLCRKKMIKFYYVPTAEEKLNLRLALIDDIEVFEYKYEE